MIGFVTWLPYKTGAPQLQAGACVHARVIAHPRHSAASDCKFGKLQSIHLLPKNVLSVCVCVCACVCVCGACVLSSLDIKVYGRLSLVTMLVLIANLANSN